MPGWSQWFCEVSVGVKEAVESLFGGQKRKRQENQQEPISGVDYSNRKGEQDSSFIEQAAPGPSSKRRRTMEAPDPAEEEHPEVFSSSPPPSSALRLLLEPLISLIC